MRLVGKTAPMVYGQHAAVRAGVRPAVSLLIRVHESTYTTPSDPCSRGIVLHSVEIVGFAGGMNVNQILKNPSTALEKRAALGNK